MGDSSGTENTRFTFTWKLENILWNVCDAGEILISPEFIIRINETNTKWCLRLYPGRSSDCMLCFLERVDNETPETITVGFELSCLPSNGEAESAYRKDNAEFAKNSLCGIGSFLRIWNWMRMLEKRSVYFPNDSFTIRCQMWWCSKFVNHFVECFAVTHFEVTSVSCSKGIHSFHQLDVPLECFLSPSEMLEIMFCQKKDSEYISAEVRFKLLTKSKIRLQCKLSVRNSRGTPFREMDKDYCFSDIKDVMTFLDFIKVIELAVKDNYLENPLNLRFDFLVHSGKYHSRIKDVKNIEPFVCLEDDLFADNSLSRELEVLYSEKRQTDVEIKSNKDSLLAHKLILRARSPIFAAMFDNNMAEKETSVVQIEDVDAATLNALLSFMYSGVAKHLDEDLAMKLLTAADKYQVLTLKKKCATFLKNIISTKNACLLFQLGDSHQEESLQRAAQEFICDHHRDMFSSDEWRLFTQQHGDLASEVFQKLSVRYKNV